MKPLDLTTLFDRDDLAEARKARNAALDRVQDAKDRRDTRDVHEAQGRLRRATNVCIKLELKGRKG